MQRKRDIGGVETEEETRKVNTSSEVLLKDSGMHLIL